MADTTSSPPACDVDGTCYCPLTGVITTLSRKYAMQLVSIIGAHDSLRFAEIEDHLPTASTSTISKRLDEFEDAGLVSRTQYNEIPPCVEYALTDDGDEIRTRLEPLLEWATANS
ncbi:winged helix-turn-helix transcriptional regulator (plasmid) [Haloferacaceae archaeon DSL9]|jgi:DNA-binding HxlR family transcriptional regulator